MDAEIAKEKTQKIQFVRGVRRSPSSPQPGTIASFLKHLIDLNEIGREISLIDQLKIRMLGSVTIGERAKYMTLQITDQRSNLTRVVCINPFDR